MTSSEAVLTRTQKYLALTGSPVTFQVTVLDPAAGLSARLRTTAPPSETISTCVTASPTRPASASGCQIFTSAVYVDAVRDSVEPMTPPFTLKRMHRFLSRVA